MVENIFFLIIFLLFDFNFKIFYLCLTNLDDKL